MGSDLSSGHSSGLASIRMAVKATTGRLRRLGGQIARSAPLAVIVASLAVAAPAATSDDPFEPIRGKWAGTGTMSFTDGTKERVVCNSQYTGTATQLSLSIGCKRPKGEVQLNAKLSANANNLLGTWREETYGVLGSVAGKISDKRIQFRITGNVFGTMDISYTRNRQNVRVKASGIVFDELVISMKRR